MDKDTSSRITKAAKYYLSRGLSVIPIGTDKSPAIKWKEYYSEPMKPHDWTFDGCNVAIVTGEINRIVVVDCDSIESYKGWLATKPPTPMRVRSKRGMHFWYKHPGQYVKSGSHIEDESGFKYDVKGDRSYVLAPPSLRSGHQYQVCVCKGNLDGAILDADSLPEFDPKWRPEKPIASYNWESQEANRINDYIYTKFAISGQGGHDVTFHVAATLRDAGMSESEALATMADWNTSNATPPWSTRDLLHKVRSAYN